MKLRICSKADCVKVAHTAIRYFNNIGEIVMDFSLADNLDNITVQGPC